MKKMVVFFFLLIAMTALFASGKTKIFYLDETNTTDLIKILDSNNIVIRLTVDVDRDADDIYVLDGSLRHVLRINLLSGKLIRIISSKGQGPAELAIPTAVRVHNDKVYITDQGFNGVKIFDINDGHLVKAIKMATGFTASMNDLDISDHGNLILKCVDPKNNSLICEFDENGDNIRTRASAVLPNDAKEYYTDTLMRYRLDKDGNLYVLFPIKRILTKYDALGNQVWQRKIENKVLKEATKEDEDDEVIVGQGNISARYHTFNISIDNNGNILIGHSGGGQLFSKDGRTIALFSGQTFFCFVFWNSGLVSFTPNGFAYIYNINPIKEGELK